MPCSLLDVKVFDVGVLGIQHGFISCVLVRVCVCGCVAQSYHMGVGFFFYKKFFFNCYMHFQGCACDWQVNLLCSLSEMSVQGRPSYMHFTPFVDFNVFFLCAVATFGDHQ